MLIRKIFSFPTLTLLVALTLSAIAAWYSVLGLTAIFAAAVIPIIIMGGSLEVAKVVTTLWLHKYWNRAGWKLKIYLIPAVAALAFLTSMGIFGFLSKAHSDQTLVSGDVSAKVELVDEKIKISRENIAMSQKALEQMNNQVDQLLGRTDDDTGANRAVQVRRQQAAERRRINQEIEAEQAEIAKLSEEVAPIRAEIRKIEAEVGPIKYIAALIYGDNPDSNLLERAVRWVIILIVFVFDPLALVLVLAAQSSYKWLDEDLRNRRKEDEDKDEAKKPVLDEVEEPKEVEKLPETIAVVEEPTPIVVPEVVEEVTQEVEEVVVEQEPIVEENVNDDAQVISTDDVEPDEVDREDDAQVQLPDSVEPSEELGQPEETLSENDRQLVHTDIQTENVTLAETDGGYIKYDGKAVNIDALKSMDPALFLQIDGGNQSSTNFGISFPRIAKKGDTFVRVDTLPNRVFKFSGTKWIEINKEQTGSYLYDREYISYLVAKIETGEYDIELLTENEKLQIEEFLLDKNIK